MDKEQKIKKTLRQIKKNYRHLSDNTFNCIEPLLKKLSFLQVSLEELEQVISSNGLSCPEVEVYSEMMDTYIHVINTIAILSNE